MMNYKSSKTQTQLGGLDIAGHSFVQSYINAPLRWETGL